MRSITAWRCDAEMPATRVLALGISTALVMLSRPKLLKPRSI